jgi:hypothetical protein
MGYKGALVVLETNAVVTKPGWKPARLIQPISQVDMPSDTHQAFNTQESVESYLCITLLLTNHTTVPHYELLK